MIKKCHPWGPHAAAAYFITSLILDLGELGMVSGTTHGAIMVLHPWRPQAAAPYFITFLIPDLGLLGMVSGSTQGGYNIFALPILR